MLVDLFAGDHTTSTTQNLEESKKKLEEIVQKIVESMNEVSL